MSELGRHGPKQLMTTLWNAKTSREALLETIADGLSQTASLHAAGMTRADWTPWKTNREVAPDTLTITSHSGHELEVPALRFTARTQVTETQHGVSESGGMRKFVGNATVTLDALAGYTAAIDEYTIFLAFAAQPGWMSVGSEVLAYETVSAIRNALCQHLRLPQQRMFHFVGGGWSNLSLAGYGDSI